MGLFSYNPMKYKSPEQMGRIYGPEAQREAELDAIALEKSHAESYERWRKWEADHPEFMSEVERERKYGYKRK